MVKTIKWKNNQVVMIDQRKLPWQETEEACSHYRQVIRAIKTMVIRGAPAIGIAAAMGMALGARSIKARSLEAFKKNQTEKDRPGNSSSPPNSRQPVLGRPQNGGKRVIAARPGIIESFKKDLIQEARRMLAEDIEVNKRLGPLGQKVIKNGETILTHCNAGALATGGYGTALGVVRAAWEAGKRIQVIADETRPFLQGARLTAWELTKDHIPVTLITDNMAGSLMKKGLIHMVIVGADRIAANGDTAINRDLFRRPFGQGPRHPFLHRRPLFDY